MTNLDKIRERHARNARGIAEDIKRWPHFENSPAAQLSADVGHLLDLFQTRPAASEPPDDDRLVIVRWGQGNVSLGQYTPDGWRVRGWVIVDGWRCPVETWQKLPPASDERKKGND